MNAQTILLTHFSARHPKIPMSVLEMTAPPSPDLRSNGGGGSPRPKSTYAPKPTIALAFDQSSMRIGDMWKMKHYLPALEQNYKDTVAIEGEAGEGDVAGLGNDVPGLLDIDLEVHLNSGTY